MYFALLRAMSRSLRFVLISVICCAVLVVEAGVSPQALYRSERKEP